jgi:hypothetical protein
MVNNNFYANLFELKQAPAFYNEILFEDSNHKINYNRINKNYSNKVNSQLLVPSYLTTNSIDGVQLTKVFQKYGYAANLNNCNSIEHYVKAHFKSSFRNNIKRSVKRVETCLDVNYKMFYGAISNNEYTFLMNCFHSMLLKRFKQRNDRNVTLENWNHYLDIAFNSINKKEASLFVMYNKAEPIAFSLNFHIDHVFYFAIPTFNLDYSKFTLGNVVIYKNLEWCLENNFKMFDMGYGGFENKVNWCNTTYNFEHHIVCSTQKNRAKMQAMLLKYKYKSINYLISKNVNTKIRNIINTIKGKKKLVLLDYKIINVEDKFIFNKDKASKIDYNNEHYKHLSKPIYDFLYINTENINTVEVFKMNDANDTYLIKGLNNQVKIEITK